MIIRGINQEEGLGLREVVMIEGPVRMYFNFSFSLILVYE